MTSDNETRAEFVSSGPSYPGESLHDAMSRNTIAHVARDARRMPTPGHGLDHAAPGHLGGHGHGHHVEPVAEKITELSRDVHRAIRPEA